MKFDMNRPAQDMTCAELMACHVAMADRGRSGDEIAERVVEIYKGLERHVVSDTGVGGIDSPISDGYTMQDPPKVKAD